MADIKKQRGSYYRAGTRHALNPPAAAFNSGIRMSGRLILGRVIIPRVFNDYNARLPRTHTGLH